MFKKLKDKITEEVKSSPQRVQQLAQAVVQGTTGAPVPSGDDGLFTLGEGSDRDDSFSSVSLKNAVSPSFKNRRNSNTSVASDVSFLPTFESHANLYHLQSDLDASASEIEDSYSGQLERVSKEQLLQAFRRMQMKYNKYRGRYTDLANHYRALERENARVKSVLVETQDKALRRVSELKEQCGLEQSAKAHMENVLREDLNEKQYLIDTLNTKIQLLQRPSIAEQLVALDPTPNEELQAQLADLRAKHDESLSEFERRINEQKNIYKELEMKVKRYEDKLAVNTKENKNKEAEIITLNFELDKWKKQLSDAQTTSAQIINGLERDATALQQEIARCKTEIESSRQHGTEQQRTIENLKLSIEERENDVRRIKEDLNQELHDKIEREELIRGLEKTICDKNAQTSNEIENFQQSKASEEAQLKQMINAKDDEIKWIREQLDKKEVQMENYKKQHKMEQGELTVELQKIINDKENEIDIIKREMERRGRDVDNYKKEQSTEMLNLNIAMAEQQKQIEALKDEISETNDSKAEGERKLTEMSNRNDNLAREVRQISNEMQTNVSDLKTKINNKDKEIKTLQRRNEQMSKKMDKSEADKQREIGKMTKQITAKDKLVTDLRNSITIKETEAKRMMEEIVQQKNAIEEQNNKLNSLQQNYDRETAEKQVLIEELNLRNVDKDVEIHALKEQLQERVKQNERLAERAGEAQVKTHEITDLKRTLKVREEDYAQLNVQFEQIEQEHAGLKKLHEETLAASVREQSACEEDLSKLKNELNEVKKELNEVTGQYELATRTSSEEYIKLQAKLDSKLKETNAVNSRLQETMRLLEESDRRCEDATREKQLVADAFKGDLAGFKTLTDRLEKEQTENNERYKVNENKMMETIKKLQANLKDKEQTYKKEVTELNGRIEALTDEKQQLSDEISAARVDESNEVRRIRHDRELLEEELNKVQLKLQETDEALSGTERRYNDELKDLADRLNDASKQKDMLGKEMAELRAKVTEQDEQVQNAEREYANKLKTAMDEAQKEQLNDASQQKEMHEREITELRKRLAEQSEAADCVKQQYEHQVKTAITELERTAEEKAILDGRQLNDALAQRDALQIEVTKLRQSTAEQSGAIGCMQEEHNRQLETTREQSNDAARQMETLQNEMAELRKKMTEQSAGVQSREEEYEKRLETALNGLGEATKQKDELCEELKTLRAELEESQRANNSLKETRDKLEEVRKENEIYRQERTTEKDELTRENASLHVALQDTRSRMQEVVQDRESATEELRRAQSYKEMLESSLKEAVNKYDQLTEQKQTVNGMNGHGRDPQITDFENEIQELEVKLSLYENMEASAKENVQYLEGELDKMRNKNEKLKSKLDETLVTLKHCADLSSSTEMEYLRNILYNYMIGKESLVLARVIAAVCKFDSAQTENVLQKEQQKQTLLGQLGLL